jgi:hypothetical protein
MIKYYVCEQIEPITIYCKVKIYSKNDLAKLDEIFDYILNMNWLYNFHYNKKV